MAIKPYKGVSSKQNWDIIEFLAGMEARKDPSALQTTKDSAVDGLEMGVFAALDGSGNLIKHAVGSTDTAGITLLDELADDFENFKFNIDDKVAVARRGFFTVKFDEANAPVANGQVLISHAGGLEGYLTSLDDVNSKEISNGAVTIEEVQDTVAIVSVRGDGLIPIA